MLGEEIPDISGQVQEIVEKYHARGEELRRLRRRIGEMERGLAEIERRLARLLERIEKEAKGEEIEH
ncbi:MAG: hypothetical protein ABIM88_09075 [candidate division WOR-3 bacterium]